MTQILYHKNMDKPKIIESDLRDFNNVLDLMTAREKIWNISAFEESMDDVYCESKFPMKIVTDGFLSFEMN